MPYWLVSIYPCFKGKFYLHLQNTSVRTTEDWSYSFLRNVDKFIPDYKGSHPERPPWEPRISRLLCNIQWCIYTPPALTLNTSPFVCFTVMSRVSSGVAYSYACISSVLHTYWSDRKNFINWEDGRWPFTNRLRLNRERCVLPQYMWSNTQQSKLGFPKKLVNLGSGNQVLRSVCLYSGRVKQRRCAMWRYSPLQ